VADLQLEQQMDVPQLRIRADRQAMARYGMTAGGLAEAIDVGFNGEVVSQVLEEGKSFDLVVRFPPALRSTAEAITHVPFNTPTGARVPLGQLARVTVERGPNEVSRENVQRKIVVQANVAGRDLGGTVADIRRRVGDAVTLPAGYYIEYGGQFESQAEATRTIAVLSLLSIAAIFLILFAYFRSARSRRLSWPTCRRLIGGCCRPRHLAHRVSPHWWVLTLRHRRRTDPFFAHYRHLQMEGVPFREAIVRIARGLSDLQTALCAGLASSAGPGRRRAGQGAADADGHRHPGRPALLARAQHGGPAGALLALRPPGGPRRTGR
jgi:hypothetical protein